MKAMHSCYYPTLLPLVRRWERFTSAVDKQRSSEAVQVLFPFKEYFADAPQPIFKGASFEAVSEGSGEGGRGHQQRAGVGKDMG